MALNLLVTPFYRQVPRPMASTNHDSEGCLVYLTHWPSFGRVVPALSVLIDELGDVDTVADSGSAVVRATSRRSRIWVSSSQCSSSMRYRLV